MDSNATESKYLVVTSQLDAPPELVWRCWTEPEHLRAWFGPDAFAIDVCTVDLRVGGRSFMDMRCLDGEYAGKHICCGLKFEELAAARRIVAEGYFADREGNEVPPEYYGNTVWPEKVEMIVELVPRDGGTLMTYTETVLPLPLQEQNWREFIAKLERHITTL